MFRIAILLFCAAVTCASGCRNDKTSDSGSNPDSDVANPELSSIQTIVSSEELILELNTRLKDLNRAAKNLTVPSGASRMLFADNFQVTDLSGEVQSSPATAYLSADVWPTNSTQDSRTGSAQVWGAFFEQVDYFETAKFYFVNGRIDPSVVPMRLNSLMGFRSQVQMKDGTLGYARAKIDVVWELTGDSLQPGKIVQWNTKKFECIRSGSLLFEEVTGSIVRDSELASDLAHSRHNEIIKNLFAGKPVKTPVDDQYRMFFADVTLEHPSVSVVDIDSDGLDDFFLARFHRPSLMFRNRGDGTFEEIGEQCGLRIPNDTTCSLFADFDNDGDPDAFVGRARHRAVYLENKDGQFGERSDLITDIELPFMVSSISAADYNRDGLLDIYLCTYSPIEGSHVDIMKGDVWLQHFLDPVEQVEYRQRLATADPYFDMAGPPNLLLKNAGGKFEFPGRDAETLQVWKKTFQASWCDFDQDGDQDVYVCNDFANDDLFRNDGEAGFVNISKESGLERIGAGMGVSWNDHNNDGQFDLYVSNMYSKAGNRITDQISGLDPRFKEMAQGNYLFEFDGERFDLVSLDDGPQKAASVTGWSWGGQMVDIDNDAFVDIVVANGYYTAPKEIAVQMDL